MSSVHPLVMAVPLTVTVTSARLRGVPVRFETPLQALQATAHGGLHRAQALGGGRDVSDDAFLHAFGWLFLIAAVPPIRPSSWRAIWPIVRPPRRIEKKSTV